MNKDTVDECFCCLLQIINEYYNDVQFSSFGDETVRRIFAGYVIERLKRTNSILRPVSVTRDKMKSSFSYLQRKHVNATAAFFEIFELVWNAIEMWQLKDNKLTTQLLYQGYFVMIHEEEINSLSERLTEWNCGIYQRDPPIMKEEEFEELKFLAHGSVFNVAFFVQNKSIMIVREAIRRQNVYFLSCLLKCGFLFVTEPYKVSVDWPRYKSAVLRLM